VVGEVDLATAPRLSQAISAALMEDRTGLVLDVSGVSFMDSTGIHALVDAARLMAEEEPLVLLSPNVQVRRVLDLLGLDGGLPGVRIVDRSHAAD
jgi:anti-anti-sigma factor